jgi:hypothetical protein
VQRTVEALDCNGFTDIITLECLLRNYEVFDHNFTTDILGNSIASSGKDSRKRPREEGTTAATEAAEVLAANGQVEGHAGIEAAALKAEAGDEVGAVAAGMEGCNMASVKEGSSDSGPEQKQQQTPAGGALSEVGTALPIDAPGTTTREQNQRQQRQQKQGGRHEDGGTSAGALAGGQQLVVTRPSHEARGHTGYLTFARKFVVMPGGG